MPLSELLCHLLTWGVQFRLAPCVSRAPLTIGGVWWRPEPCRCRGHFCCQSIILASRFSGLLLVTSSNKAVACSAGLSSSCRLHHCSMVLSASWLLGSVCPVLDQFLAIPAHLLRPYIQGCLLRFLRSLSLFDFWRDLLLFLASFCCPLCVFSPSFTSVCTTLAS